MTSRPAFRPAVSSNVAAAPSFPGFSRSTAAGTPCRGGDAVPGEVADQPLGLVARAGIVLLDAQHDRLFRMSDERHRRGHGAGALRLDRKSTRLNSSHITFSRIPS